MWDRLPCERLHARIFFSFLLHFFTFYFDGLKTFWSPQGSPQMFCLTTGGYILLHCTFSVFFLANFYTDSGYLHHLTFLIPFSFWLSSLFVFIPARAFWQSFRAGSF